jgi:hypothetical protein
MTTAFQTGPGFYAAESNKNNPRIPPGVVRIYCARIEAYDLPDDDDLADSISFTLLVALSETDPRIGRALQQLMSSLDGNRSTLETFTS